MSAFAERRGFLRGLVSLSLIGGGVTLIGKSVATAVPIVEAMAAAPILVSPQERARYAWVAFSAALDEITPDCDGWRVTGASRRPYRDLDDSAFLKVERLHYLAGTEPRCPDLIIERHSEFLLA